MNNIGNIIFFALLYTGSTYIFAAFKNHTSLIGKKPKKMVSFISDSNVNDTQNAILAFAKDKGYEIVFIDEANGQIILEKKMSWKDHGFFMTIFISKRQETGTLIEIGSESKSFASFFGSYDSNRSLKESPNDITYQIKLISNSKKEVVLQQPNPAQNSKYCTSCGKQMSLESKFCTNCGKLNTASQITSK